MPASYIDGQFTSCEGELQDVVGIYTANGQSESSTSRSTDRCINLFTTHYQL